MRRRTLLGLVAAGTVSVAGCTTERGTADPASGTNPGTDTDGGDGTPSPAPVPEECPTSQGLDVEWPTELDAAMVESFVEAYEHIYYRDVVVEYEPESELDSYELSGGVMDGPRERGDGWELSYSGSGGIYRPTLAMGATTADAPESADVVSASEIDDDLLGELLVEAAETGQAETHVDPPGEKIDDYVDLLASLSDDFDRLSGKGDRETLYADVDGTTVELSVTATNFHGDYWWNAWYYVDKRVVRRTDDEDTDPRNGKLLECRGPE